jgi:hypothetical protein
MLRRHHDCEPGDCLRQDFVERDLGAVGFTTRRQLRGPDGHVDVIIDDCPGVRLRALIEALRAADTTGPHEVAWHIVRRSAALRAHFPRTLARHGDVQRSIGCDPDGDGLARERAVLALLDRPPPPATEAAAAMEAQSADTRWLARLSSWLRRSRAR